MAAGGRLSDRTAWLEGVLERMPDGFFVLDAAGRYLFANSAAAASGGTTREALLGRCLWELAPQTVGSPFHQACVKALQEGATTTHVDVSYDHGDRRRWYDLAVFPFEDGVAVHFRDVTDRKATEEELRKFQFMVDQSPEEAYLARPDGSLVYVNEATARSVGYTRDELLRLGVPGIDPQAGPLFRSHFEELKARSLPPFETVHVARDGRRVTKEIHSVHVRIGEEEFVCGFGRDVSARKAAERRTERGLQLERALREVDRCIIERAELRETLEVICRAVVGLGFRLCWVGLAEADGEIHPVAAAGAELDYAARIRVRWDDSLEGRGPTGSALRSGQAFVCESTAEDPRFAPWRDEAARRRFGSSVAQPLISAEREVIGTLNAYREEAGPFAEEDLHSLETLGGQCTLAVLSARRQQALREAERQLAAAQRMEAVGTLAGGIAHDFNNLLTGIVGFTQLLRDRLAGDPEAASDLDEVLTSAERASALTRQLLAFARRQVIAPARVDLNGLVGDLVKLLRRVVGEHIELVVDLAPGLPPVLVDPGQLEQVLMNLCVNARDAMPEGGTLRIDTFEDRPGATSGSAPVRQVVARVSDTGVGIPEAVKDRVFEPFFTTKPQGRGSGLGLAVSYGIVKQHGGSLTFESQPGEGTSFEVRLPVAEGTAEARRPAAVPGVRGGTETILVADDEPLIRSLAERALSALGYRVLLARDGAEALDLVRERGGAVDLVVLDAVMPRMRGPAAYERMRALRPGLRALFVSGYAEEAIHEPLFALRGAPFLAKPFGPASLARKVREVLDGHAPDDGA